LDKISPDRRSANMSQIRGRDMAPEMAVRRLLFSLGYRYRLHPKNLPGKPDIVFPGRRKIIFVHGCFWHQHGDPSCKIAHIPKSKQDYWVPKLQRNQTRDIEVLTALEAVGWKVLVVWECELRDKNTLTNKLTEFINNVPSTHKKP